MGLGPGTEPLGASGQVKNLVGLGVGVGPPAQEHLARAGHRAKALGSESEKSSISFSTPSTCSYDPDGPCVLGSWGPHNPRTTVLLPLSCWLRAAEESEPCTQSLAFGN